MPPAATSPAAFRTVAPPVAPVSEFDPGDRLRIRRRGAEVAEGMLYWLSARVECSTAEFRKAARSLWVALGGAEGSAKGEASRALFRLEDAGHALLDRSAGRSVVRVLPPHAVTNRDGLARFAGWRCPSVRRRLEASEGERFEERRFGADGSGAEADGEPRPPDWVVRGADEDEDAFAVRTREAFGAVPVAFARSRLAEVVAALPSLEEALRDFLREPAGAGGAADQPTEIFGQTRTPRSSSRLGGYGFRPAGEADDGPLGRLPAGGGGGRCGGTFWVGGGPPRRLPSNLLRTAARWTAAPAADVLWGETGSGEGELRLPPGLPLPRMLEPLLAADGAECRRRLGHTAWLRLDDRTAAGLARLLSRVPRTPGEFDAALPRRRRPRRRTAR